MGFEDAENEMIKLLEYENKRLTGELAAANARVAELETESDTWSASVNHHRQQLVNANQRAEQAEAILSSHAPDGHQYTNQQFVDMRLAKEQAEAQLREVGQAEANWEETDGDYWRKRAEIAEGTVVNQCDRIIKAEAQCAAMRLHICNQCELSTPDKCEGDNFNCIGKPNIGTALLDENRRMREKNETYEQAIIDVCKVINKVKCDINYPRRKELCLELNKLCRLLRESNSKNVAMMGPQQALKSGVTIPSIDPSDKSIIVKLHPSSEGGYAASIPSMPGCITQGETIPETLEMLADACRGWMEIKAEDEAK